MLFNLKKLVKYLIKSCVLNYLRNDLFFVGMYDIYIKFNDGYIFGFFFRVYIFLDSGVVCNVIVYFFKDRGL